jgi:ribosome-associated translation inhibitor RaiA
MTDQIQPISNIDPHARWKFIRDVAVFQLKLFLNNVHNFVQIPLTLAVALVDVIFKTEPEGARFYKFLELGRRIDDSIDIYSVIDHREASLNKDFTVDAVISRLEGVIVREYEKGGTAASVKAAVDRAIDGLQTRADVSKQKVSTAAQRAADTLRQKTSGTDAT